MRKLMIVASSAVWMISQTGSTTAQNGSADKWLQLGTAKIEPAACETRVDLTASTGRSKSIRLVGREGVAAIDRLKVVYSSGQVHIEERAFVIKAGEMSRRIDEREEERFVDLLELKCKSNEPPTTAAVIDIWGLQSPEGQRAERAPPPSPALTGRLANSPLPPNQTNGTAALKRVSTREILLGAVDVSSVPERKELPVARNTGTVRSIQLQARGNAVEIDEVKITYASGHTETKVVNAKLPANTKSKWIDLPGRQSIRQVELAYRLPSGNPETATLQVLGRNSSSSNGVAMMKGSSDGTILKSSGGRGPEPEVLHASVPVFYATNREKLKDPRKLADNPQAIQFGSDDAGTLSFGVAMVNVPGKPRWPAFEWSRRVVKWVPGIGGYITEDPDQDLFLTDLIDKSQGIFLDEIKMRLKQPDQFMGKALVFVHGFNTSFDDALKRAAQIKYHTQFEGPVIVFSWPAITASFNPIELLEAYTSSRERVQASEKHFLQLLTMIEKEAGAREIHLMSHSMGGQLLVSALKTIDDRGMGSMIANSEVIMAAPDVGVSIVTQVVERLAGKVRGVTIYASASDKALQASAKLALGPRAGESPNSIPYVFPRPPVEAIDITAAGDVFGVNHNIFATSPVLGDIGLILCRPEVIQTPPGQPKGSDDSRCETVHVPPQIRDRNQLKPVTKPHNHWVFKPVK